MTRWMAVLALIPAVAAAQTTSPSIAEPILIDTVVVVPPVNSQVGHAVQKATVDPKAPVQHVPELFEGFFSSLDARSRGLNDVQTDLSVRGSTFDQVLILVDGIPYSDPQTGHHSTNLPVPTEAIASVSLLPSGGSYRFGPFAFAGVLEIRTHQPWSSKGYASASAGAFGYQRAAAGVPLLRKPNLASRLDVAYSAADGALPNTDFATWQAYWRTERRLEGSALLRAQVGYTAKMFGAQSFYSFRYPEQFEHVRGLTGSLSYVRGPWNASAYARQHDDRFELFRENANYYVPFGSGRWMRVADSTLTPTWYTGPNVHRNRTTGGEATYRRVGDAGEFTGGIDVRRDQIWSNALGMAMVDSLPTNWGTFTRFDARTNAGGFVSAQRRRGPWAAQADLRLNWNDRYGLDWLPHLGAEFRGRATAFASVNRSFRLPTFTDLYYSLGGAQGSALLRPEYAWNSEVGVKVGTLSRAVRAAQLTAYERRGVNLIDWIYRSVDGAQVLQADNITSVAIRGLELEFRGDFHGAWVARAQVATHQASDVVGQSIYALDYLARRVQFQWNSALQRDGSAAPLQFGLVVIGQDRAGSYLLGGGESTPYVPFATVDLRASYRLGELLLYADGMNVLDATVVDRGTVPLPGRWLKVGLQLAWGE